MPSEKIPISFWGTPALAASFLSTLIEDGRFDVRYVLTQPDKSRVQRGRELVPSPVKKVALQNDIEVLTPGSLKKESQPILHLMKSNPVAFHVVLAYGKIIPDEMIELPSLKAVNFHASLLPALRGPAPIEYALMLDLKETGWSLQRITDRLDAGDVYAKMVVPIAYQDTRDTLTSKLVQALCDDGCEVLHDYAKGKLIAKPQEEAQATYTEKIRTEMGCLDLRKPALILRNLARALSEKPGVYLLISHGESKKKLKVEIDFMVKPEEVVARRGEPGKISAIEDELLWLGCGEGSLPVRRLQWEGKKKLLVKDFLNGYPWKTGHSIDVVYPEANKTL